MSKGWRDKGVIRQTSFFLERVISTKTLRWERVPMIQAPGVREGEREGERELKVRKVTGNHLGTEGTVKTLTLT